MVLDRSVLVFPCRDIPQLPPKGKMLIAQSCPKDCSPPGSSVHGDSPDKNTGMGCHFLLQGIFLTRGSNPCFLRFLRRQVCYRRETGHLLMTHFSTVPLGVSRVFTGSAWVEGSLFLWFLSHWSRARPTMPRTEAAVVMPAWSFPGQMCSVSI